MGYKKMLTDDEIKAIKERNENMRKAEKSAKNRKLREDALKKLKKKYPDDPAIKTKGPKGISTGMRD